VTHNLDMISLPISRNCLSCARLKTFGSKPELHKSQHSKHNCDNQSNLQKRQWYYLTLLIDCHVCVYELRFACCNLCRPGFISSQGQRQFIGKTKSLVYLLIIFPIRASLLFVLCTSSSEL